jgi:hypothetical protein
MEQEQALYQLRVEKEGAMRTEIAQQRETLEAQARANQVGLRIQGACILVEAGFICCAFCSCLGCVSSSQAGAVPAVN